MDHRQDPSESFPPLENQIVLTDELMIEWKPVLNRAPVKVSSIEIDGYSGHLIRTAPGNGWVRLYLPLDLPEIGILAARFVLQIAQGDAPAKIKPLLVKTNTQTGSRRPFATVPDQGVLLDSDEWYEIAGAFLHTSFVGRFRPGIVIDLPRGAAVLLMDVSFKRFRVPLSETARAELLAADVMPFAPFSARRVKGLISALESPPVYAASLSSHPSMLSGWLISDAERLFWREQTSGRGGEIEFGPAEIAKGEVRFQAGITVAFDPPLDEGAILHLTTAPNDPSPIWTGSLTHMVAGGAPLTDFIEIRTARIKTGLLAVEGDVVNPLYPGMPVRVDLMRETEIIASGIAVAPAISTLQLEAGKAFQFRFSVPVRPNDEEKAFWLAFPGAEHDARLYLPVARLDGRRPIRKIEMATVPEMPADGEIAGEVDGFGFDVIEGWAICLQEPDSPVELVLYNDGVPVSYSKTRYYRKDIRDIYGNLGFNGFRFEVPPNATALREVEMEVRPIGRRNPLVKGKMTTELPPGIVAPAALPAPRVWTAGAAPEVALTGRVSVIVLNLDGAELLDAMFDSCASEDLNGEIEWIVVDHGSTDDSRGVCERHAAKGADIRFLARRSNCSFSDSNNFGVTHATGDILVFANNDLIFDQGFSARLRDYMRRPEIGAVGVRLLDHIDHPRRKDLRIDQHLGVFFESRVTPQNWVRPYEARACAEIDGIVETVRCIAVTGAFLAMRRSDFEAVGGFDESYFYGLEDIDLCLKVRTTLDRDIVCANDITVTHRRGFSRRKDTSSAHWRQRNNEIFTGRWGETLRRMVKRTSLAHPGYITGIRPVFSFMVTDVGDETPFGDYYTALELGRALQRILPCHVRYVPESDWYDLSGIDVVVAMVNRFDIAKGRNASPWLVTVNWMRQWFDRWAEDASLYAYDFLFASSAPACEMLEARTDRPVHLLPIASSYHDFAEAKLKDDWQSDYSFTGNRFGPPREIEFQLDPGRIEGKGKVFGHNWEGTPFETLGQGPVPYSSIPRVYGSTRVVLDDANVATKPWGSCNSRVFDAMSSGALLISNGELGCRELFGDLVPTFHDADSLTETLNYWLKNEPERIARAKEMQEVIRTGHTYDVRARELLSHLTEKAPIRIAIKCAATYKEREQWGDFHYAQSLAAALRRQGFVARVDCRESWDSGVSNSDDVVIALRGLRRYVPKRHQTNLLWLISHPNAISISELEEFDHAYVASQYHADSLAQLVPGRIDFMPQCTDTTRFFFDAAEINSQPNRNLYVANSRGVLRDPVRWAIQHELDIDIYGVGWEAFITDERFKGGVISNQVLGGFYASSRLVICDHWDDMKALGYVSNRVFDVLGAGGRLAVDGVRGLADLVPPDYANCFEGVEEFTAILNGADLVDLDKRRDVADWVKRTHSFDARAAVFAEKIRSEMAVDPVILR
ncbi:glycosyltransferase family protein [Jannaschia formosa]|uniref:glycosyltransferase family protein n=1 Tax=Jannaschia formosa TaxID=2259592 RepID=UPI000E1B58D7|nr:glycosyltransferase [Jannaschia formosa]TFL15997.1 glycosyltransferase [Jannaschia formosa]